MDPFNTHVSTLYHFTDRCNLPSILEHDGLLSWDLLQERRIQVLSPGGNDLSRDLDRAFDGHQYVHLCFFNQHPMAFRAQQEGRIADPVFLPVDRQILETKGVLFSADVSNKNGVDLLSRHEAASVFDFDVMHGWQDYKNPDVMKRIVIARRYEVLVPDDIPLRFLKNFRSYLSL